MYVLFKSGTKYINFYNEKDSAIFYFGNYLFVLSASRHLST